VDDMTERWNAAEFKDTYHDDLMARIRQKIKLGQTKEITKPDANEEGAHSGNVIDLALLLKQSLGKSADERKSAPRHEPPAKAVKGAKTALHVVAATASKRGPKSATKAASRRKRA
jgi:DNA end-binding protein Ku